MASAIVAMGCFWTPEMIFRSIDGFDDETAGDYAGRHVKIVSDVFGLARIGFFGSLDGLRRDNGPIAQDRPYAAGECRCRSIISIDDETSQTEAQDSQAQVRAGAEPNQSNVTAIEPADNAWRTKRRYQRLLKKTDSVGL